MIVSDVKQASDISLDGASNSPVKVAIIGVGGGGSNAIDNMISAGVKVDTFMAINTDRQALRLSKAKTRIQIGSKITKGFGAGAKYEVGEKAAEESREVLTNWIKDKDLVFITAGMGGGTGTGAAPVVAQIAHDMGKLTLAFVTTPFKFEGEQRRLNAEVGIARIRPHVDSLIIIPNEQLAQVTQDMTIIDAFKYADDVLRQGVQAITDLITNPGQINVDFADICTVLKNGGDSFMGIGRASGEKRAIEAVTRAVNNPILNVSIAGATKVIVYVEGRDLRMNEINHAVDLVRDVCSPSVNLIFGYSKVAALEDEIQVTVIAAGFNKNAGAAQSQAQDEKIVQEPVIQQPPQEQNHDYREQQSFFAQPRQEQRPQPAPQRRNGLVQLDDEQEQDWLRRLGNK